MAGAQGRSLRAARLLGAAEALMEAIGSCFDPPYRAELDRNLAPARAGIGEEMFAKEVAAGRAMSMEEAIAYALEPLPEPEPQAQP